MSRESNATKQTIARPHQIPRQCDSQAMTNNASRRRAMTMKQSTPHQIRHQWNSNDEETIKPAQILSGMTIVQNAANPYQNVPEWMILIIEGWRRLCCCNENEYDSWPCSKKWEIFSKQYCRNVRRNDNISIDGMCAPQSQFSITRNAPWTRVVNGLMATNSFIEFGTNNHTA